MQLYDKMINYNDDKRIDPKFYENDGSERKNVRKILVIVVLFCFSVLGLAKWIEYHRGPALPGEVILKGDMDMAEADAMLQEAGYIPKGDVITDDQHYHRYYQSSEAFGFTTDCSVLTVSKSGTEVNFVHWFTDESEENNADVPGNTWRTIATTLREKIWGNPRVIDEEVNGWFWKLNKRTKVSLIYSRDNRFLLEYEYWK